jgi:SAM-dependent methyltransferase
VIIALKIGRFTHADAGQMHLYLNYARKRWVHEGENPPVGLILCAQQDEAVVKNYPCKSVKICLPNEISFAFISSGCPNKLKFDFCDVIEGDFETYDFSRLSVDAIMLVGALVHLPHSKVPEVLNSITKALKGNGKILLTLKKGTGRSSDPHGRVFNLWQDDALRKLFNRLELVVIDFFKQSSEICTDEVWLGYVLEKAGH